ncbi:MAG: IS21 family transposase [Lachnospiraceae bacterium]|nr:IS21 family transposase [Lachnospiraceae bacterium]
MKQMEDWAAVQMVYRQTKSKRATAETLGIARNTVRSLLKMNHEPVYHRTVTHSKIDPYKDQILEWRCAPYEFNGTRIFKELKKRGYKGSIGPVYYYLRQLDEDVGGISSKATVRHESPPGDQAQFDWSEYEMDVGGRYRTVYCFAMILAASRKKAICFSLREDADAIYEAIQELFDDLGGVTLELLIDNPKALVVSNDPKSEEEIKYNPYALLLAKHLGCELNACPCYWPRKKGKIERPFAYIEEQFVKGNTFASMEDLNRQGKKFIDEWCNEVHGTTKRIPNEHYELEERMMLQPLPKTHFYAKEAKPRKVSPDSLVSIDANKYSVPVKYADKNVSYRLLYGFRIEIYDRKNCLILRTEAAEGKGNERREKKHYEDIAKRTPTSIPQIRREFTEMFSNGALFLTEAEKRFDQPTHYARKIMELRDLYDDETLDAFIGEAIKQGTLDFKSFKSMLKEYNRLTGPPPDTESETDHEMAVIQAISDEGLTRDCSYYEDMIREGAV